MSRLRTFVALTATLGLLTTACGSDSDTASADAFEGMSITIGSKNFGEQYLLSEMLIQAMIARGADVTDATDTGDTPTTRLALLDGEIDAYFEYNSTGWVQHLGNADPASDGEELTDDVAEADAANGITWVGRSSFNNTYGFAPSADIAEDTQATRYSVEAFDLEAMAEYLDDNDDTTVCVEAEFPERDDGLVLFEAETEYQIPESQLSVFDDAAAVYEAMDGGDCDFAEVFTTDGELDALGLEPVVDPGVFYVYNVSLNVSSDLYDQAPEAFDDVVDDILGPLTQQRITELNRRVAEGENLAEVAADFLETYEVNPD